MFARTTSMPTPRPLVSVTSLRVERPGREHQVEDLPAREVVARVDHAALDRAAVRTASASMPRPSSVAAITTSLPRW